MVIKWIIGHSVLELACCIHPLRTSSIAYRMSETIRINRLHTGCTACSGNDACSPKMTPPLTAYSCTCFPLPQMGNPLL